MEVKMHEQRCSVCRQLFPEEELLTREDNGESVCVDCSGLLSEEDLSCIHDEW